MTTKLAAEQNYLVWNKELLDILKEVKRAVKLGHYKFAKQRIHLTEHSLKRMNDFLDELVEYE